MGNQTSDEEGFPCMVRFTRSFRHTKRTGRPFVLTHAAAYDHGLI